MASATETRDTLIKRLQQEREGRSYPVSSRWYQFLTNAIHFVQEAEFANSPKDRFYNAWSAIYNVAMMTRKRGQAENVTLSSWVKEIQSAPQVRRVCESISLDFLKSLERVQNYLLRDGERNQWRESKQYVDSWQQKIERGQVVSPEKACTHTFLIGRDLRNAVSHADFNPNSNFIRKALAEAANVYFPLAIAVIEASIEHPPEGTTGKANPYRSFLYPFLINSDSFFSDYYLERLMYEKELVHFIDEAIKGQLKSFNQEKIKRDNQLSFANTVEATLEQWCQPVLFPALGIEAQTGTRIVTETGIFEPTGVIALAEQDVQAEYQGKAARPDLACLVWVLPWRSPSLDAIPAEQKQLSEEESPFAGLTYMEIAQRSLLGSDVPWGIVTNGRKLRLLSKGTAHKPRAFVEMDLEEMIQQRGTQEGKLAFRYLLGLFAGEAFTALDDKDCTRLDRVLNDSKRHGEEISEELKKNVFRALEELGDGFLEYMKAQPDQVTVFSADYSLEPTPSDALLTGVYQESLILMYRLLFLFYAESRDMLPMEDALYRETYSLESIRDEIISVRDDPDPTRFFGKGSLNLWSQLRELFSLVENGGLNNRIPAYDGGLFDPENHPFLETFAIGDYYLARAIDLLSRTRPSKNGPKGKGRKKVTYRDLDIRHLGSIYEGILEYSARIAEEELAVLDVGKSGKTDERYVPFSRLPENQLEYVASVRELNQEGEDVSILPKSCKVRDIKDIGQYYLEYGGRESKRRSSGSYYTPDYIVQYIVENALGPLVRGENREGNLLGIPLTSEEILKLKVLDPSMGSGHFLVASTEYLARAYGEALIRNSENKGEIIDNEQFIRHKRKIAESCIYGVDINSMAVELAKLSMWLFTMDKSRPLSFLNHHFKCGNSLIGAWIEDLGRLPEFDKNGNPKKIKIQRDQQNLFDYHFKTQLPSMVGSLLGIMSQETKTYQDIEAKKALDKAIEEIKKPFKNIADLWLSSFFGVRIRNYDSYLLDVNQARSIESTIAKENNFFHWELSFPEVFFDDSGYKLPKPGFDAIVGNPPYLNVELIQKPHKLYFAQIYSSLYKRFDIFGLFIELSITKNTEAGLVSFIIPSQIFNNISFEKLRELLLSNGWLKDAVYLGDKIFDSASNDVCILTLQRPGSGKIRLINALNFDRQKSSEVDSGYFGSFGNVINVNVNEVDDQIFGKIFNPSYTTIEDCFNIFQGIVTGKNEAYLLTEEQIQSLEIENVLLHPILLGRDFEKWYIRNPNRKILYVDSDTNIEDYPNAKNWLLRFYDILIERRECKKNVIPWYSLQWARVKSQLDYTPKILIQRTRNPRLKDRIVATIDEIGFHGMESIIFLSPKTPKAPVYFLSGILNSSLINYLYTTKYLNVAVKNEYLKNTPFPISNQNEQNRISELVRNALALKQGRGHGNISEIETEINRLVYQIYGLTRREIEAVEKLFEKKQ